MVKPARDVLESMVTELPKAGNWSSGPHANNVFLQDLSLFEPFRRQDLKGSPVGKPVNYKL